MPPHTPASRRHPPLESCGHSRGQRIQSRRSAGWKQTPTPKKKPRELGRHRGLWVPAATGTCVTMGEPFKKKPRECEFGASSGFPTGGAGNLWWATGTQPNHLALETLPTSSKRKNAACLKRCGQTCPAFSQVGKALFDAWVIGACRPRPTFLRVLATALSIVRHVTPSWAHIPRRTIQSSRRFGNQDCLHAAQQTIG